ncbi:MAG TPA: cytochrome c oxidase assembly protein, partial [Gaiellales bacterium]|nr:cytochrome c oxidase assembly protein [Gaiellales bacterium]
MVDTHQFVFDPEWAVAVVIAAVDYAVVARAHRRRGIPVPWYRWACFMSGLALISIALFSPVEHLALTSMLSFHLLQNVMLADWAPPLLVLGLTPAMRAAVAARGGRWFARLTRPRLVLPFWLLVWYGVHLPAFYDFALRHPLMLNIEHLLLLGAGLLFWWPVFSELPQHLSTALKLAYLGAAYVGSAFLSLALIFSSSAFYGFYEAAPRLWGLSPDKDQNLGGILMNGEQMLVFFAALSYFLMRLLSEEE